MLRVKRRSQIEDVGATSVPVRVMEYDMRDFLQQCVDKYLELAVPHVAQIAESRNPILFRCTASTGV